MRKNKPITEITAKAFSKTGPLSKLIRNYIPNPVQARYAEKVAGVFEGASKNKPSIGLIEAGTGIGKTLGYATPLLLYAALTGKRVAISTYTIQLQSQLLDSGGDIDIARQVVHQLTGKQLVVAPRLGLRNFVSPIRIRAAMAERNLTDANTPESVKKFLLWAVTSKSGLLMEWNRLHGEIPSEFSIAEICCGQHLPDTEKQRYLTHKEHAKSADVIITNHALLLLHTVSKNYSVLDDAGSRPLSIIVADEADRIEDAARLLSDESVALMSIRGLFSKQDDPFSPIISQGLKSISDIARKVDQDTTSHFNLSDNPDVASEINFHIAKILPLFDKSMAVCVDPEARAEIFLYKTALSQFKEKIFKGSDWTTPVIHYSDIKRYPSLRAVNPNPGTSLGWLFHNDAKKDKESYVDAVLLTSATLSDGQESSLKTTANNLGLFLSKSHDLTTAIFEPTDFGVLSIVLPDLNAPAPTLSLADDAFSSNPEWVAYVADMVIEATKAGGRVLVLTLSYRDTRMIADKLRPLMPSALSIIQHTESDPAQELLDRFTATEGAVLLSPICWEGVNLPGLVKNLVITRIPFAPPDRTVADIIKKAMQKKAISDEIISSVAYAVSITRTRRKLRQAIGRGIRQKTDVSRIWIGDKRILAQKGKLKLESCLPVRFHPALKEADTFTLDRVVTSPEIVDTPDSWASMGKYS